MLPVQLYLPRDDPVEIMAVDVRFGRAGSTTYLGIRMLEEVSGAKFFNIPYARITRAMQGFLTHDIKDGGACAPWRHGAFYFGQEKQRWRRKAVMCLRSTSATLKIFRSIRRRWTAPTWAGIRLLRHRLGLIQEGFAKRYGIPLSSIRQYEIARTMPPPVRAYLTVIEREPEMAARRSIPVPRES